VVRLKYTVNVIEEKCIGCSLCARICPTGTLQIDKQEKKAYTTNEMCDNAWGCVFVCPTKALEIVEAR
jgi:Fe-S-cluster-containing hydrogenase component 2